SDLGGSMRLGAQNCQLAEDSLIHSIYKKEIVYERHRHRYEFNNNYLDKLKESGLSFSGVSKDGLVEGIELPEHPWFLACQFHPEFTSNPLNGHPLFISFVSAARACKETNPQKDDSA
ncbi:MAG: CTP synthetase, partial [Gammaproteobacteria bacterium]|nr:CTP synthetase [Gammaproteobacteria bacterium]